MAWSTVARPSDEQLPEPRPNTPRKKKAPVASAYTLARWQLKQTWHLLVVTGLGLLIATLLVCAIPLYAQISLSAGLRRTLAADPQNTFITVSAQSSLFDTATVQSVQSALSEQVTETLGPGIVGQPAISVQIGSLAVSSEVFLRVIGTDMSQARGHVKLLDGHLPVASSGDTIQFAATNEGRRALGLKLGQILTVPYPIFDPTNPQAIVSLHFQLAGIIAQTSASDSFWHGETFATEALSFAGVYQVLVSNTELMNVLTDISQGFTQKGNGTLFSPSGQPSIFWYYDFNLSHLDINHLSDLTGALNAFLSAVPNNPAAPYVNNMVAIGPLSVLQNYSDRVTVLQLPILCMTFLIGALALFFVLLMTDVLGERQAEAIILLRSRGASGRQVFGSLMVQSVILGLLAFIGGPLAVMLLVVAPGIAGLSATQSEALNVVTANPGATILGLLGRDLLIVGVALVAMALSIGRLMRSNVLTLRRESARSTSRPFWLRYKLDLLAVAVALTGFGLSLYIASPGVLNLNTRTLILPLTSLVGVFFLLIGCLLLLLRVLPALLNWGERMAARNRGAVPMLALAQMARSPRQALRMVLLFALAVALTLFTVVFSATQAERLQDLTTYQVGSDFSGSIPQDLQSDDWNELLAYYHGIRGITSVTMGDEESLVGGSQENVNVSLVAVDSSSYASTMYWTRQYSDQSISALMKQLQNTRAQADRQDVIPAIIDDAAAQSLNVRVGQQFVLTDYHGPISYMVTAIVHYIPTVYDIAGGNGIDSTVPQGGVLVDFQTYSDVALAVNEDGVSASVVWLRAQNSAAAINTARQELFTGTYALENGLDRQIQVQELTTDPMYRNLVSILAVGSAVALLMALFGNLLVAWLNARNRRPNFAILRALGCEPFQIAHVLIWEQGIVYGISLVLGVALSMLFVLVILPGLIFSPLLSQGSIEVFYLVQNVPAVQVAIPARELLGVLGLLLLICAVATSMMTRIVSRSSTAQVLRLSED